MKDGHKITFRGESDQVMLRWIDSIELPPEAMGLYITVLEQL